MVVGGQNVINEPLVARDRIILPPLHIKLGLMKQFVKALNRRETGIICPILKKKVINLTAIIIEALHYWI